GGVACPRAYSSRAVSSLIPGTRLQFGWAHSPPHEVGRVCVWVRSRRFPFPLRGDLSAGSTTREYTPVSLYSLVWRLPVRVGVGFAPYRRGCRLPLPCGRGRVCPASAL
ncbi:unnamed protein product, partial [Pylaiella littoralis]